MFLKSNMFLEGTCEAHVYLCILLGEQVLVDCLWVLLLMNIGSSGSVIQIK